jgi:Asp-tRNA(Asn)/Glu-tRNA(Gln) amidotransferase A subunit family amidase
MLLMPPAPIAALRERYLQQKTTPLVELECALTHASTNASRNTYLAQDPDWSRAQAEHLDPAHLATQPLWGIPVSLKDCFDLAGFPTSCGAAFYLQRNGTATDDSTVAARLRVAGAVITGKTHLHQLAYGITGENSDFGDCLQPRNPDHLTGGSSSGAVASIQEGSALAAIGTDTGGSIRVPAALGGLAGYRSSITLNTPDLWRGGAHLAPSFDTLGWIYSDLRDGPTLGHALFNLPFAPTPEISTLRIGIPDASFFHDCEPAILATLANYQSRLAAFGASIDTFDTALWQDAVDILAPLQASEAAALHAGLFQHFEETIADRLAWGASIPAAELNALRTRMFHFREYTYALFRRFDYLLLPCSPMAALLAGTDQTDIRARILRYTSPISLAGLPTVTLPGEQGGLQFVGNLNSDASLLALSATLA